MTAATPGSAELLAGCPFCGKPLALGSRKINPKAYCETEDCYGRKMSVVNLDDPVCVKAWNTRLAAKPDEATHEIAAAPPKPAPDMREADNDRLITTMAFAMQGAQFALQNGRALDVALSSLTIALQIEADHWQKYARLSAPVPPADRALATGILNSLEETAKYLRRADPATVDMDGITQVLLTGIKQLAILSLPVQPCAGEREVLDELNSTATFAEGNATAPGGHDKDTWAAHARSIRKVIALLSNSEEVGK